MTVAPSRRRVAAGALVLLALAAAIAATRVVGTGGETAPPARSAADGPLTGGSVAGGTDSEHAASGGSAGPEGGAVSVIVPGRPGEPARVMPDDQVDPAPERHNSMDIWFVRMMIPHHAQALRMAALAPQRAGDPRIRALADRIRASQLPEIQVLQGWLAARNLNPEHPRGGHDHASMPGMQSEAALTRLAEAGGAEFDRMFIEMMTAHHRGAVAMATDVLRVGIDGRIQEFASAVAVEQGVEIDRMGELLRDVSAPDRPAR